MTAAYASSSVPIPGDAIRLVCLDAAGTLFHLKGSLGALYARHALAHGLPASTDLPNRLERRFYRQFPAMPRPEYRCGEAAYNDRIDRDWWRTLVKRVFEGLGPMDFEAFFEEVYALFAEASVWQLYPEVPAVLDGLRAAGLKLAIVSNFDSRLTPVCKGLDLFMAVDTVLIASAAGAAKPDALIFRSALEHFGVPPEHALHVGDSWEEDALGAIGAGLHAVHLQRSDIEARPILEHGVPVIRDLSGLAGLIMGGAETPSAAARR